jgi:LasA protease
MRTVVSLITGFTLSTFAFAAEEPARKWNHAPRVPRQADPVIHNRTAEPALASAAKLATAEHPSFADSDASTPGLEPYVEVLKQHQSLSLTDNWVVGSITKVIPIGTDVHSVPTMLLFLAKKVLGKWQVAPQGTPLWKVLLQEVPPEIIAASEKAFLLSEAAETEGLATGATSTGLGLPFPAGEDWMMGGGPHGSDGSSRPFSSIDFNGGKGRVVAPADGYLYRSCEKNGSAMLSIVHANGFATEYYHMVSLTNLANGSPIKAGTYLGNIGNGLPCGGSTTGPHVHFQVKKNGKLVSVHGLQFGGWTFYEGQASYQGYAERNGVRVNVGAMKLRNQGLAALSEGAEGSTEEGSVAQGSSVGEAVSSQEADRISSGATTNAGTDAANPSSEDQNNQRSLASAG